MLGISHAELPVPSGDSSYSYLSALCTLHWPGGPVNGPGRAGPANERA